MGMGSGLTAAEDGNDDASDAETSAETMAIVPSVMSNRSLAVVFMVAPLKNQIIGGTMKWP